MGNKKYNHLIVATNFEGYEERSPVFLYGDFFTQYSYITLPLAKYGSLLDLYMSANSKNHMFSEPMKLYFFR